MFNFIKQPLNKYANNIKHQLKQIYPEPKTHEFLVIDRYNYIIQSMVDEYVINMIPKII